MAYNDLDYTVFALYGCSGKCCGRNNRKRGKNAMGHSLFTEPSIRWEKLQPYAFAISAANSLTKLIQHNPSLDISDMLAWYDAYIEHGTSMSLTRHEPNSINFDIYERDPAVGDRSQSLSNELYTDQSIKVISLACLFDGRFGLSKAEFGAWRFFESSQFEKFLFVARTAISCHRKRGSN